MRRHPSRLDINFLKRDSGGALLAALVLVVISAIMGATILFATSTDLQISGNFRRSVQTFYAAEAGLAEAQRRLAGSPVTNPWFAGDPSAIPQPNWSAYLLAVPSWDPQHDATFSTQFTNYVPINGNFVNTVIAPNSVQTSLPYWTKIRHKTEYDAEQA
ncbi:MAG: pilus assembly PilX N-terminal domain-containing protein, partial [Nitrospirales bacterium]|nr:pilus assembly PilX N-terminal domain-containing protein [Nitrospirales bacterium]